MDADPGLSMRSRYLVDAFAPLLRFFTDSTWASRFGKPGVCDFTIGNPHDMPLKSFVDALQSKITPQDAYWYAYKRNEPEARRIVAASLEASHRLPFEPEDIFLTNGATAALHVVLAATVDPGDEVIFLSPPWFQYETMIMNAGGTPVRVRVDPVTFDPDLKAIEAKINGKTKAVIINSPHNPTGRIYSPQTLEALSCILLDGSKQYGRHIRLISDEAYRRIVFDGRTYFSPVCFYPDSFIVYTYGKALLAPGERIGYIALHPDMSHRMEFRSTIPALQMIQGWSFPNALLQHAIGDLEKISVDITHLQAKRDRLVSELLRMGYATQTPEATFYLLVRSPIPDDEEFVQLLTEYDIFCIPGSLMDLPGYFRMSITASDEMIERALPGFEAAIKRVRLQGAS
ncbi:aminotransferase class I/II-fold pyridoxal phosphate-dependent enzyme [Desulforhabdus sp. TSK]|uniref:aminotransferase class I/II-fold pyridoxal phosphate-dependent enzyme n=1 Tax=Desulforhabdus sp. TSK TaxID=2925014 RepID=UPI001FC7C9CE|nr:aminotransferase class I/II-fold pyridoxal phosphate-dependent enzyme [Desulforhabdus sp. TSK]GKT07627.1 aminotransferase [Desulforhabdus sp. TSK]